MLHPYWYDKIASAAADAEAAIADEVAANEAAGAEDQGAIEKIEDDIEIAQEIAATDLPTEVKVEIMEEQGVDPEIIDEVVDADVTDAVAAYYGVDPYWLHDKRAAMSLSLFDKRANKGKFVRKSDYDDLLRRRDLLADTFTDYRDDTDAKIKDYLAQIAGLEKDVNTTGTDLRKALFREGMYKDQEKQLKSTIDNLTTKHDILNGMLETTQGRYGKMSDALKTYHQRKKAEIEGLKADYDAATAALGDMTKSRDAWKRGSMIGAGVVGAGLAGYAGLQAYRKRKAAQKAAAEQAAAQQAAALQAGNLRNAGIGAGVGGLGGAALGYALGGGKGALMGGIGGAGLGGAAGYYGNAGVDAYKNWRAS